MDNNIYIAGVAVSLIIFSIIGLLAGKRVKNKNDYYVAGRRAPTLLITGSLIASFLSTGAFMGDTGEVYKGFFMGIVIVGVIQATGYIFGASFFGKYIRRSKVNTVPEYFGIRFGSKRMQVLSSLILIIAVSAYLLSAIQGVSTLMQSITGLSYGVCVLITWLSFTLFTVYSGSMGVLITDTAMFLVFLAAALIGIPFVIDAAGGWFPGIAELATSQTNPGIIAWTNNLDYKYPSGWENLAWAITYGIVWALVVAVSPWQTSRYLMAKNEHVVMRSSIFASIGVIIVTTALYFTAAFVYAINPDLADPSTSIIWAAMTLMPTIIGVVILTGILAAGISSATTFLSLIGFSIVNDIGNTGSRLNSSKRTLFISRLTMSIASIVILIIAYTNPPQIFMIMYFGGSVIAGSWGIVAFASVWSKKLSESGAFWGMLLGFLVCAGAKAAFAFIEYNPPVILDPFFLGLFASVVGMVLGSVLHPITGSELKIREMLHVVSETDNNAVEMRKTHHLAYVYFAFAFAFGLFFVIFYAVPYTNAVALA